MIYLTLLIVSRQDQIHGCAGLWHNMSSEKEAEAKALSADDIRPRLLEGWTVEAFDANQVSLDYLFQDLDVLFAQRGRQGRQGGLGIGAEDRE